MEAIMDIEKTMRERHELLERLRDSLQEELIICEILEAENENEPEVLRVLFDELGQDNEEGVLGEFFFFPPGSDEDEVQHFSAVIAVADEIDKSKLPQLFEAMSYINFRIPCGSFCVDEEGEVLVYRLTTPFSAQMKGDDIYGQMNICMTNALICTDMYMDILLQILEGSETADLKTLLT